MRLRTIFSVFSLFCIAPISGHADPISELRAKSAAVSRSVSNNVAVEQAKNQERIKLQTRIDRLRNEAWKANRTSEERKSIQREMDQLQAQLNKL